MDQELMLFLISLIAGVFWFRAFFLFAPQTYKNRPFTRSVTGLGWHHWHHGIVFLTIGIGIVIFQGNATLAFILLGLGLGLVVDEFFMTLRLQTQRAEELKIYYQSFGETLLLTLGISAVFLLISFLL